jgi:hypothetical protein
VSTMPKRDNVSTGRRPSPRASPVPAGRAHSAGAKSVVTFTLSDVEWERIRSTRDWSEDVDWRREIEQIGQDFWELRAFKEMWVNELRGKHPAKQREKIRKAGILMRRSQEVLAELANDGLLGDDFSPPNLNWPEPRFKEWLSEYEFWVQPFAGRSDPIQSDLEWRLMNLWKRSGGKLAYSKKKDDPGTPYGPLVDFLTNTLDAILGKALKPSGVAKLIDRHRGQKVHTYLMFAMHTRIEIADDMPWDQE